MTDYEAILARHSVRKYRADKIEDEKIAQISDIVSECNRLSGQNIRLYTEEPRAFGSLFVTYGRFKNVNNYLAVTGEKNKKAAELLGYYCEKITLKAIALGLNACWVGMNYSKRKTPIKIEKGEKLYCLIALGYGEDNGHPRRTKTIEELSVSEAEHTPEWFIEGIKAVQLAPTSMNQQRFKFILHKDGSVSAKPLMAINAYLDLGIAKYHFEIGSGKTGLFGL